MKDFQQVFNNKNIKKKKINNNSNISKNKNINLISQEQKILMNKVPQIINNYDVKVNITKEKSNNININNMNINSLYSKSENINDFYNIDDNKKSNIFKNIKLNNYFNKTENFFSSKESSKKIINPEKISIKILNNKKKVNYEAIINKLKKEFKIIEKSYKKDNLNKTQTLNNNIKFSNKKNNLKGLKIKLLKINNNDNNINKRNKIVQNNLGGIFLSTDLTLLKDINNASIKFINDSQEKKLFAPKSKYSFDLSNFSSFRKDKNKVFKFKNFNDIYDNLININNINLTTNNKSVHSNNKKKINIKYSKINYNSTKHSKDNKNQRININNDIKLNSQGFSKNIFKCNLFKNLNKLTFDNTIYNRSIINQKIYNYRICKNISFGFYYSKFDKYNNYFTYDKKFKNDYNFNLEKNMNILNEIIKIQKKFIIQQKQKEEKLKEEINIKINEIKSFKNAFLKIIYYIKNENDIYKRLYEIQSKLYKENEILKHIILSNRLFLFNPEENKLEQFHLTLEKEKRYNLDKNKNKLINSKDKKELIYKMLNKNKINNSTQYKLRNNSYEHEIKNKTCQKHIKKNNHILIKDKNNNKTKKLFYLIHKKK